MMEKGEEGIGPNTKKPKMPQCGGTPVADDIFDSECGAEENEDENEASEVYNVEGILKHRTYGELYQRGLVVRQDASDEDLFFKVKWDGYPVEESTWEPMRNLEHLVLLENYMRKNGLRSKGGAGNMQIDTLKVDDVKPKCEVISGAKTSVHILDGACEKPKQKRKRNPKTDVRQLKKKEGTGAATDSNRAKNGAHKRTVSGATTDGDRAKDGAHKRTVSGATIDGDRAKDGVHKRTVSGATADSDRAEDDIHKEAASGATTSSGGAKADVHKRTAPGATADSDKAKIDVRNRTASEAAPRKLRLVPRKIHLDSHLSRTLMVTKGLRRYNSTLSMSSVAQDECCQEERFAHGIFRDDFAAEQFKNSSAGRVILIYLFVSLKKAQQMWSSFKSLQPTFLSFWWKVCSMHDRCGVSFSRAKGVLFKKLEVNFLENIKHYMMSSLSDTFEDGLNKLVAFGDGTKSRMDSVIAEVCAVGKKADASPLGVLLTSSRCIGHNKCRIAEVILKNASPPLRAVLLDQLNDFAKGNILQRVFMASNCEEICIIKVLLEYGVDGNSGDPPIIVLAAQKGFKNMVIRLARIGCSADSLRQYNLSDSFIPAEFRRLSQAS